MPARRRPCLRPLRSGVSALIALSVWAATPLSADESRDALNRHLEQAQIHLDSERYASVVEELEQALRIHARIPGAHYQLGFAHWSLGDLSKAKAAFQAELGFEPPDAHSLYYLGRIALSEGDTQEAVGHFERALNAGNVLDVRSRLASGYLSLGRVEDAVRLLEETVSRWPERGDSHYLLARGYQRLGRTAEARREFDLAERWKNKLQDEMRGLVELRMLLQQKKLYDASAKAKALAASGDPDVMLAAAIALGGNGFHSEALPILRRVVEERPRFPEALYNLALARVSLEQPEQAIPLLNEAIDLRPEFYEARMLLGNLLVQGGANEKAIDHLRAAFQIRPGNAKLAAFLGLQFLQGRFYQDAVNTLRTAVELDPASSDLRFLLVDAHYKNHDFEEALAQARDAAEAFPNLANSHYQVAWQLENMGQFTESRRFLERALGIDPAFVEARRMLGEVTLRLGETEAAIDHFRQALTQEPSSADAYAGLGKALIQLKRYEEAAREMERAIGVDPELASLHLYLSQAYRALGRMDEAKREATVFTRLNRIRAQKRDQDVERVYEPEADRHAQ